MECAGIVFDDFALKAVCIEAIVGGWSERIARIVETQFEKLPDGAIVKVTSGRVAERILFGSQEARKERIELVSIFAIGK